MNELHIDDLVIVDNGWTARVTEINAFSEKRYTVRGLGVIAETRKVSRENLTPAVFCADCGEPIRKGDADSDGNCPDCAAQWTPQVGEFVKLHDSVKRSDGEQVGVLVSITPKEIIHAKVTVTAYRVHIGQDRIDFFRDELSPAPIYPEAAPTTPLQDFLHVRALSLAQANRDLETKFFVERGGLFVELTEHPTSVCKPRGKDEYTLWSDNGFIGTVYFDKMGERLYNYVRSELVRGWDKFYNPATGATLWACPGSIEHKCIAAEFEAVR